MSSPVRLALPAPSFLLPPTLAKVPGVWYKIKMMFAGMKTEKTICFPRASAGKGVLPASARVRRQANFCLKEIIDGNRMLVFVKGAKGRKDRYTLLSEATLKALREYWKEYKPTKCLFPGPDKERHITIRTAQRIFEMACERAGVKIPVV
jgi:hypothetical protein